MSGWRKRQIQDRQMDKPETYLKRLQEELRLLVEHNENTLGYVRLLNAQVSGNTHRITELQHKIAKELKTGPYSEEINK
jgi:glutamate/tyrosine decarboxylase-like PLP-dependent enzyme